MSSHKLLITLFSIFALLTIIIVVAALWIGLRGVQRINNVTSVKTNNTQLAMLLDSAHEMLKETYFYASAMLLLALIVSLSILFVESLMVTRW